MKLLRTDTSEMSEEELAVHNQKLNKAVLKDMNIAAGGEQEQRDAARGG